LLDREWPKQVPETESSRSTLFKEAWEVFMAANPNIAPQIERTFKQETVQAHDLHPVGMKQRFLDLLLEIFEGYEDFLGWTPD
jgi:hypothetical protein